MNEEMNQNVETEETETVEGEVFEEEELAEEGFLTKSKNWIKRNKKKLAVGGIAVVAGIVGYLLGGKTSDNGSNSLEIIDLPPENLSEEESEDSESDEESDPE